MRNGSGVLAALAFAVAVAGCSGLGVFGHTSVSCDGLSPDKWKSLARGDRRDEAEAIEECGTLDGMTRAEVRDWMGKPIERSVDIESSNKLESWLTGNSSHYSDLPMITVEYGKDGTVTGVSVTDAP